MWVLVSVPGGVHKIDDLDDALGKAKDLLERGERIVCFQKHWGKQYAEPDDHPIQTGRT